MTMVLAGVGHSLSVYIGGDKRTAIIAALLRMLRQQPVQNSAPIQTMFFVF